MGDDEVGAEPHGFVDDLLHRVDREQDPGDLGVGVTADGADGVPLLGPRGGQRASRAAMTSQRRGTGQGYRPWRPLVAVPGTPAPRSTATPRATSESPGRHPYV